MVISVKFTLGLLSAAEHAIGMWNFGGTMWDSSNGAQLCHQARDILLA